MAHFAIVIAGPRSDAAVLLSTCHGCHCHGRMPLLDCVPVVVVAAAVVFRLRLEGGRHGDNDLDRGCVDIVDVDKGLSRSEKNKHNELDCSCN